MITQQEIDKLVILNKQLTDERDLQAQKIIDLYARILGLQEIVKNLEGE